MSHPNIKMATLFLSPRFCDVQAFPADPNISITFHRLLHLPRRTLFNDSRQRSLARFYLPNLNTRVV